MFKFIVRCYDEKDIHGNFVNKVIVELSAETEAGSIFKAKKLIERKLYEVVRIEEVTNAEAEEEA